MEHIDTKYGYVKIANKLLEALAMTKITSRQRRVIDAIIRKTYGYNKKEDYISYSQISKMTQIDRRSIIRIIRSLIERNIISILKNDNIKGNLYRINKQFQMWDNVTRGSDNATRSGSVTSATGGSGKMNKKVVASTPPTKDNITKDNIKDNKDKRRRKHHDADPDFKRVIDYILKSREDKLKIKYMFTAKNAGQLKRLVNFYGHTQILAAWDIFITDRIDDPDKFWRKGYTLDKFTDNSCIAICMEYFGFKDLVRKHEQIFFNYKNIIPDKKNYCDACFQTDCKNRSNNIKDCQYRITNKESIKTVVDDLLNSLK